VSDVAIPENQRQAVILTVTIPSGPDITSSLIVLAADFRVIQFDPRRQRSSDNALRRSITKR
jgi:hypothetical protein